MSLGSPSHRDLSEAFSDALEAGGRWLFWASALAFLGGAGVLLYACFAASGDATLTEHALSNIDNFEKVFYGGLIGLGVSTTLMWWGEQVLAPLQLILAAALWTVPLWLSPQLQSPNNKAAMAAMNSLHNGGVIFGVIGIIVLVADIATRARDRFTVGAKADQIKLGKNVKEEADRQNVFMGKCWQLPFCRKFVRDRCPIYHSKRTCWRELVGCMCEEDVIRGAMENRTISKDAVVAASMIPRNNRLTAGQKKERCKTCVIYNEHQKHKYRASVWGIFLGSVGLYLLLHEPLLFLTKGLIDAVSKVVNGAMYRPNSAGAAATDWFSEGLLFVFFVLFVSYAMKILEYLVFTLKV